MSKNTTSKKTTNKKANSEVKDYPATYGYVTNDTSKLIESDNLLPWRRAWSTTGLAMSVTSHRVYNLLNQLLLGKAGNWGSYNTWQKLGYKVKKGEHGSRVYEWFYVKPKKDKTEESDDKADETKKSWKGKPILKYYTVFHESQVESIADGKPYKAKKSKAKKVDPIESAEKFVEDYKELSKIKAIKTNKSSNEAYYNPEKDVIVAPKLEQYKTANDFYSTLFHEIIHSTGHKDRLDRGFGEKVAFGSEEYSNEELVAELGSAFICARLGIDNAKTVKDSAKYCKGWLKALKSDAGLLVSASSYAEKAVKYAFGEI